MSASDNEREKIAPQPKTWTMPVVLLPSMTLVRIGAPCTSISQSSGQASQVQS
ncbi:hypothetical protein [Ktedonobacter sp. SOSP1-85]|uniref:hypothetical protein n=1 Tax=Ktedonobacter sp. SOSP1-85 TaxID=2778367 RepID=UPI0019158817|nr:hypothetical protein [Ktedonobacter sp. SOSP1-85]